MDDIESDLSVFHRIDDPTALDGPRYFRLVWRLAAYQGVMQARTLAARDEQQQSPAAGPRHEAGTGRRDINPGIRATLQAEPAFAGVFSFGAPDG
ncbi:hypothetical protein OG455_41180 [Kitasatospora sp. NBC_01287]|uniref:hypothetical protein n=1 Tax=Kitasatospora sp. NBC_01287 TaxID=2903573 RepID=UPI00225A4796|nr:hypothetical protein [Kitasatospora sp. NBC_01287]MCX4750896.1 hypothetical protein [Kitasatospora sp. NBC_01287]MCX4751855.1 hypothetical protein [Kitasatospora sp. NBC_01287]